MFPVRMTQDLLGFGPRLVHMSLTNYEVRGCPTGRARLERLKWHSPWLSRTTSPITRGASEQNLRNDHVPDAYETRPLGVRFQPRIYEPDKV